MNPTGHNEAPIPANTCNAATTSASAPAGGVSEVSGGGGMRSRRESVPASASKRSSRLGRPASRAPPAACATASTPTAPAEIAVPFATEPSISSQELREIESRAVEASGLKAEVVRLAHERHVAETKAELLSTKLAKLQPGAAASELESRAAEIEALRAELVEVVHDWSTKHSAATMEVEALEAARSAAIEDVAKAEAARKRAEQTMLDGLSKSKEQMHQLTSEYDKVSHPILTPFFLPTTHVKEAPVE